MLTKMSSWRALLFGLCCAACSTAQAEHRPLTPPPKVRLGRTMGPFLLPAVTVAPARHPLEGLTGKELLQIIATDPVALGSVSIGRPAHGALFNGVELTSNDYIQVMGKKRAWGTVETIFSLNTAAKTVKDAFPNGDRLRVGDISRRRGGYLRPHRSHQSGCDADVGYYYKGDQGWYTKATEDNLDLERNWTLFRALMAGGNVEYIFMDRSVQAQLFDHALARGEDPEWLDTLFDKTNRRKDTLFRHTRGHKTHFHVRFFNQEARETSRHVYPYLVRSGKI